MPATYSARRRALQNHGRDKEEHACDGVKLRTTPPFRRAAAALQMWEPTRRAGGRHAGGSLCLSETVPATRLRPATHRAAPGPGAESSRRIAAGLAGAKRGQPALRSFGQGVRSRGGARGRRRRLDELLPPTPRVGAGKPGAANLCPRSWEAARRGCVVLSLQPGDPRFAAVHPCLCPPRADPHRTAPGALPGTAPRRQESFPRSIAGLTACHK